MALKTIGSLWTGKSGSKAKLSGYLDGPNRTKGPKIFVFPNEKATAENRQPQYRLVQEDGDEEHGNRGGDFGGHGDSDDTPF